jgi:hypothetical protein
MSEPEPKIYAPLLLQLETEHPKLAPLLIGIGDAPVEYDAGKREVEARFQTEAGTLFSGKYRTEPGTAREDAKEFLARMAGKLQGVLASDKTILGAPPVAPPQNSVEPPPSEDEDDEQDDDEDDEDDEDDADPAPAAAEDADWDEPKEPDPQ